MPPEPNLDFIGSAQFFIYSILFFGSIFFVVERLAPAEKNTPFFKKDFALELGLSFLNTVLCGPVFRFGIALFLIKYIAPFIPYQFFDSFIQSFPLPLQIVLGMLIADLSTYWRHRFTHNYMWKFHSIHHSALQLTWLTALRLHPVDVLVATLFDTAFLYVLGFSGEGIALAALMMGTYNFFTHTNLNLSFPKPIRYILASPNFHRWHHANQKDAYNKNYCSVFSCLDLLFGTYHHPESALPEQYGLSDKEQKDYPPTLAGQLIYPFKTTKKKNADPT